MKRRYLKRLIIISSILIAAVVVYLIIWPQSLEYKKKRLRTLFDEALREYPLGLPPRGVQNLNKWDELRRGVMKEIVTLAYSDISLFRELLNTVEERFPKELDPADTLHNSLLTHFSSAPLSRPPSFLSEIAFYGRDEMNELIDMLEKLDPDDWQLRLIVAGAIASHTWKTRIIMKDEKLGPLKDRPLSAGMVTRIINILKKDRERIENIIIKEKASPTFYQWQPHVRHCWAANWLIPKEAFYYAALLDCMSAGYYEYESVRRFLFDIMLNPRQPSLKGYWVLFAAHWNIEDSEAVDVVVQILLDRNLSVRVKGAASAAFLNEITGGMGRKINTPNKEKWFEALCKAVETDPNGAGPIEIIRYLDDPKAKAFLEKLKSKDKK